MNDVKPLSLTDAWGAVVAVGTSFAVGAWLPLITDTPQDPIGPEQLLAAAAGTAIVHLPILLWVTRSRKVALVGTIAAMTIWCSIVGVARGLPCDLRDPAAIVTDGAILVALAMIFRCRLAWYNAVGIALVTTLLVGIPIGFQYTMQVN